MRNFMVVLALSVLFTSCYLETSTLETSGASLRFSGEYSGTASRLVVFFQDPDDLLPDSEYATPSVDFVNSEASRALVGPVEVAPLPTADSYSVSMKNVVKQQPYHVFAYFFAEVAGLEYVAGYASTLDSGTPVVLESNQSEVELAFTGLPLPDGLVIEIATSAELSSIGVEPEYPLDGLYALAGDITVEGPLDPIGSDADPFTGVFDGGGFAVRVFDINATGSDYVGLFAVLDGAEVSNLAIEQALVVGDNWVGALAGDVRAGSVTSVTIDDGTSVVGNRNVGGVAGASSGVIEEVVSRAEVEGDSFGNFEGQVGGLIGENRAGGSVSESVVDASEVAITGERAVGGALGVNRGSVNNVSVEGLIEVFTMDEGGGFVGRNEGTIDRATTVADVFGEAQLGGFVGSNDGGTIDIARSNGAVFAENLGGDVVYNGGFVGRNSGGISRAEAHGFLEQADTGESNGGFVGYNAGGNIRDSAAHGDVRGEGQLLGGFVGLNGADGLVLRTFFRGELAFDGLGEPEENTGAFAGALAFTNPGSIEVSYYDTDTNGGYGGDPWPPVGADNGHEANYASLEGLDTSQMQNANSYVDWDFDDTWAIDEAINDGYPHVVELY